jgi:hypothetical protein
MTFENSTEKGKKMPVQSIWQYPKIDMKLVSGSFMGYVPLISRQTILLPTRL